MSMSRIILAFDTGFNWEVDDESILCFRGPAELTTLVDKVEESHVGYLPLGELARRIISENYSWDIITTQYVSMFLEGLSTVEGEG